MEFVCTFPTLNSHETDIPEERGAMYRDYGVTFQFAESSHSCPASSDIKGFCLRNHKVNSVQSLLFLMWVIEARQLYILENDHAPCHGHLDKFEWLEKGLFPKIMVDYQIPIVNLFHSMTDLYRQVILYTECLTFFTSSVPPALCHLLSIIA